MAAIVKVYEEIMPAGRFIGKRYTEADSQGQAGGFSAKWSEWFQNGWFRALEAAGCDGSDYYALMRVLPGCGFEYWIGMFFPVGADVPDGYACVDIDETRIATAWIKGVEPDVYAMEDACAPAFEQAGLKIAKQAIYFERYNCPRFTAPDENGEIILDFCATLA